MNVHIARLGLLYVYAHIGYVYLTHMKISEYIKHYIPVNRTTLCRIIHGSGQTILCMAIYYLLVSCLIVHGAIVA